MSVTHRQYRISNKIQLNFLHRPLFTAQNTENRSNYQKRQLKIGRQTHAHTLTQTQTLNFIIFSLLRSEMNCGRTCM